ncbi:kynureninase [Brevibacillus composti]|uniref:Kynureninase n=1 Tax=Brevibacillus composti TaxID=2796470 RepID=A0A7T5ENS2_9BACL|nr:kynureninase [Brevibacillus composti]QQE75968.1 kynureninase [Brevibacillus composti]QUO42994.1 kynureninase [Brevibacillus composti]
MNGSLFLPSEAYALERDAADGLAHFRSEFYLPQKGIYLDGNSLGVMSVRAEQAVADVMDDWKRHGIDGWTEGERPWFYQAERLAEWMAPLVGAAADEVIVSGSTTVNLHQLAATFYQPVGKRTKILADELTFPSDLYALQSQLRLRGYDPDEHLVLVKSRDGRFLDEADIISSMTEEIALIVLPTVLYRSGQLLDIPLLTAEAHKRGIPIGFDGCHSVGVIPHRFQEWDVDFAYWCSYKYLNGGPGSVAALYVNRRHLGRMPGLAGWFGSDKEKQFDLGPVFTPASTAGAYQIGTPHILSMAPLLGALPMFAEAGIEAIREKSLQLTAYLMALLEAELAGYGFVIGNPREDERRGGHVSLEHPEAARICKALKANGVIPDFRAPHVIRLAPVPLYTSFHDVWSAVRRLKQIMEERSYEQFENRRGVIA